MIKIMIFFFIIRVFLPTHLFSFCLRIYKFIEQELNLIPHFIIPYLKVSRQNIPVDRLGHLLPEEVYYRDEVASSISGKFVLQVEVNHLFAYQEF